MRYLTERKEPKNIGKRAIKTKLEYATNIPSGVAAALPVAFLAVSFTAAERFATVSFTSDSAILTLRCSFVRGRGRQSQKSLLAWTRRLFPFQWPKYTLLFREHNFHLLTFSSLYIRGQSSILLRGMFSFAIFQKKKKLRL